MPRDILKGKLKDLFRVAGYRRTVGAAVVLREGNDIREETEGLSGEEREDENHCEAAETWSWETCTRATDVGGREEAADATGLQTTGAA